MSDAFLDRDQLGIILEYAYRGAAQSGDCHINRNPGCVLCDSLSDAEEALGIEPDITERHWWRKPRIWFYRPQLHWFGWKTLSPIVLGGDEWDRWTIMLGWTVTGRVVIALWE